MPDVEALLDLPLATLAVLVSGYLGYRIAYIGKDSTHKAVDIAFITLSFGLVAKLVFSQAIYPIPYASANAVLALTATLVAASIWRGWGDSAAKKVLRAARVSFSDGHSSAWDTIRLSTKDRPTQLVVRKTDGSQVMCERLETHAKMPHGPCIYGPDGSVAIYVTQYRPASGGNWIKTSFADEVYGVALTYIPAQQIDEIEIRNLFTDPA